MDGAENYFVEELRAYFAERGKRLSARVVNVLSKTPLHFTPRDREDYQALVAPSRRVIKQALREMLEGDEARRREWASHFFLHSHTVIGGIVAEVLAETGPPVCMAGGFAGSEGPRGSGEPGDGASGARAEEATAKRGKRKSGVTPAGRAKAPCGDKPASPWRKALRVMEWAATIVLALVVLAAAFLMLAPRFGVSAHPVLSGSMEPALKVGGLIFCRKIPVNEVEVGDIIGFNAQQGEKVTHRVIDVREEDGKRWFQTKGDANEDPDPDLVAIGEEKVDKVVYHLPYLGFFSSFMQSKLAFLVFICAPAFILIVLFGRDLWVAVGEFREGRKRASAGKSLGEGG